MNAHDPDLGSGSARRALLRWFGRAPARLVEEPANGHANGNGQAHPPLFLETTRDRRRRETLEDIGRFLLTHRLPVTPFTLEAAYDVITGANPQLGKLVAERVARREAVTLHWLEDRIEEQGRCDGAEQIHTLIHRLETALGEFADTASAARTATSDYNSALESHVQDIPPETEATEAMLELAALARDMIGRTREIERELTRSERETRALQKSLDDARRDAEIDHLTGLPNRRAFEAVLKQQYARCHRSGAPLCVAFCDIDHFKRINDIHGHDAGDRVLRAVAQSLARIVGDRCHVARHGGEEFVILMHDTAIDDAFAMVDGAREDMAARKLVNRTTDTPFGRVSFSAGLADVHAYRDTRAALRAADEALFRAKDAGRNRVLIATLDDHSDGDAT